MSASTTLDATYLNHIVICNDGGANYTLTLPSPATCAYQSLTIQADKNQTHVVTVANGPTGLTLSANNAVTLYSDNASWRAVSGYFH